MYEIKILFFIICAIRIYSLHLKCLNNFSCEDVSSSDVYTCLLNPATSGVGKWQKDGSDVDPPLDVTCNCPELKVADEVRNSFSMMIAIYISIDNSVIMANVDKISRKSRPFTNNKLLYETVYV